MNGRGTDVLGAHALIWLLSCAACSDDAGHAVPGPAPGSSTEAGVEAGAHARDAQVEPSADADASLDAALEADAQRPRADDAAAEDASALDATSSHDASREDAAADAMPLQEAPGGDVTGHGFVGIDGTKSNPVIGLQTTLNVPAEPPASGTLFLWPGIQPIGGTDAYEPVDNGVLQPVLTWGPSCAPGKQPKSYSTWWVSAQYVNTYTSDADFKGCRGGDIESVSVGDRLSMTMTLAGNVWKQTVTDLQTQQEVSYDIDLLGQVQAYAEFVIEGYSSSPVGDVVFDDTTITFLHGDKSLCKLARRGTHDFVSTPMPSSDGKTCFIEKIILRSQ